MGGEMRGHTSNRLLRACLRGVIERNRREMARRPKEDWEFFQGCVHTAQEIAILMYLDLGESNDPPKEILEEETSTGE